MVLDAITRIVPVAPPHVPALAELADWSALGLREVEFPGPSFPPLSNNRGEAHRAGIKSAATTSAGTIVIGLLTQ
jgi:hypothetical protein